MNVTTDYRKPSFYIQLLIADRLSKYEKSFAAIGEKMIADTEQLSDFEFKTEILSELNGTRFELVHPPTHGDKLRFVAVLLMKPNSVLRCDRKAAS